MSEISYEMTFDAGHRIVGHKGKCARLHGHTYKVHIMASGPVSPPGFVVDFGDLKEIVNEWDHMLLLWDQDPFVENWLTITQVREAGIVAVSFNPTAEHMSEYLCRRFVDEFSLFSCMVELWETPKCMARYVIEG